MSSFSINDKRKFSGTEADEEVLVGVPEQTVEQPQVPQVVFENEETYKLAVSSFREKLVGMINEGFMTESVASRLLDDFMFNTFNQIVQLKLG